MSGPPIKVVISETQHKGIKITRTIRRYKNRSTTDYTVWSIAKNPRKFKTLSEAQKAITAWEHKQFKRDKPKGWD